MSARPVLGPPRLVRLLVAAAMLAATGCTDVGDDSAVSGAAGATLVDDASASTLDASAEDGPHPSGDASLVDATLPVADDALAPPVDDAGPPAPSSADDAGASDATLSVDASAPDSATAPPDTGSSIDATSPADAGGDAAHPDAATDAGPSALAPCTSSGQTGCVQCQYNDGAEGALPNAGQICTPTEAALVAHDVARGLATAPGPDPSGSCYQCAALSGCLDDSEFADTDHECEDVTSNGAPTACEATLACILATSCGASALSTCYCGAAPVSGTCAAVGSSNAANGACVTAEAAGLGLSPTDGLDILKNFTSTTLASGVANNIFQCATSNGCTACLQ